MQGPESSKPNHWSSIIKSSIILFHPGVGKDRRQEEKGMTEDEMVAWHRQLNGHEFEQVPRVGDAQGIPVCCSP